MSEQKYLETIKNFRLIDDTFFNACFDNNEPDVEYILRIILEKSDLKVLKVQTQKSVENMYGSYGRALRRGRDDEKKENLLDNIRSLMKTMKWTATQAMDALKVPADKQTEYAALIYIASFFYFPLYKNCSLSLLLL